MIRQVALLFSFVVLTHQLLAVINRNCNFVTSDSCMRIADDIKLEYKDMREECHKHDLSMMPPDADVFKKLRQILYFRYPQVNQLPLGTFVNNDQDRAKIETGTGLKIVNAKGSTGWPTYNYNDNQLYLVDATIKLPTVCWSSFKGRLQCPPGFKLFYPRKTCYGLLWDDTRIYTHEGCKRGCRAMNANLGSFHTAEERRNYMMWFGLHDKKWGERLWIGTRFEVAKNKLKVLEKEAIRAQAYNMDGSKWTNFKGAFNPEEPNGAYGLQEHCVEWYLHSPKAYNDLSCNDKNNGCLCETAPDQTNVQY